MENLVPALNFHRKEMIIYILVAWIENAVSMDVVVVVVAVS
jgi:hypothetical protein